MGFFFLFFFFFSNACFRQLSIDPVITGSEVKKKDL